MKIYEKRYTNIEKTRYNIYVIYPDGSERIISEQQDVYQKWLSDDVNNLPIEKEYVPKKIDSPIRPNNPEFKFIALPYDKMIAEIVAYRMDKAGYSTTYCTGVLATVLAIMQIPEENRTNEQKWVLNSANELEQLRQSIIEKVYHDYPTQYTGYGYGYCCKTENSIFVNDYFKIFSEYQG